MGTGGKNNLIFAKTAFQAGLLQDFTDFTRFATPQIHFDFGDHDMIGFERTDAVCDGGNLIVRAIAGRSEQSPFAPCRHAPDGIGNRRYAMRVVGEIDDYASRVSQLEMVEPPRIVVLVAIELTQAGSHLRLAVTHGAGHPDRPRAHCEYCATRRR